MKFYNYNDSDFLQWAELLMGVLSVLKNKTQSDIFEKMAW